MQVGDLVVRKWPKRMHLNDAPVGVIVEEKLEAPWSHDLDTTMKYFLIMWSNCENRLLLCPDQELEVISTKDNEEKETHNVRKEK